MTIHPIPIAIVGSGRIATAAHLPALAATVDPRTADHGVPHFDSFEALLASGIAIGAVALCTPPSLRAGLAREALERDLHVLLEKPPAMTLGNLDGLGGEGPTLFAAWHSRFAPFITEATEWLGQGRLTGGRIEWKEDARVWHPGQAWLWQAGGLGVFDPLINAFSILTAITPTSWTARTIRLDLPDNQQAPIALEGTLACGGADIAVAADFRHPGDPVWTIELERDDGARLTLSEGGSAMALGGGPPQRRPSAEYPALYARFAELIDRSGSDLDVAPLRLVADCLLVATRRNVERFDP